MTLWTVVIYCSTPRREKPVEFAVPGPVVTTRRHIYPVPLPRELIALHCNTAALLAQTAWALAGPQPWKQVGGSKNLPRDVG